MLSSYRHLVVPVVLLFASVSLLSACLGDRCGPGQTLERGICKEVDVDAGADRGLADGSSLDQLTSEGGGSGGYGDYCTTQEECQGKAASYCLIRHDAVDGYCSTIDCTVASDAGPDDCPSGFYCLDLGQFVPGLPTVCAKNE